MTGQVRINSILLDSGKRWILSIVSVHFYVETLLIVYITFVSFCENTKIFMYKVTTITNIIYIFYIWTPERGIYIFMMYG